MSTRVQKGGQRFKPVVKPRTREITTSRQNSHVPEANETPAISNQDSLASLPPNLPEQYADTTQLQSLTREHPSFPTNDLHSNDSNDSQHLTPPTIKDASNNNIPQQETRLIPTVRPSSSIIPVIRASALEKSHNAPYAVSVTGLSVDSGPVTPSSSTHYVTQSQAGPQPRGLDIHGRQRSTAELPSPESLALNIDPAAPIHHQIGNNGIHEARTETLLRSSPEGSSTRRKRAKSASSKPKKSRTTSPTPLSDGADPGEDLDPTLTTMAAICSDTGQGRVSSKATEIRKNFIAWKAMNRDKRLKMRAAMEAKKFGRPEEPEQETPASTATASEPNESQVGTLPSASDLSSVQVSAGRDDDEVTHDTSGFDYSEAVSVDRFNVQVRIGPNGETIIDEETLYVDRTDDPEGVTEEYTHIEESDSTKFVNSLTYSRKTRGSRWSAEETELFYDALAQFGENYELISYVLPGRDRKACKNKFKAEDKRNSNRISFCLKNRVPYDIQTLSRMTGKDFSGPTPIIKAPEIRKMSDAEASSIKAPPQKNKTQKNTRKSSQTPGPPDAAVEILGDLNSFGADDEEDLT